MEYKYTQPLEELKVRDSISNVYRVNDDGTKERVQIEFIGLPYRFDHTFIGYVSTHITPEMIRKDLEERLTPFFESETEIPPFTLFRNMRREDNITREELEKYRDANFYIILDTNSQPCEGREDVFEYVTTVIQFCKMGN